MTDNQDTCGPYLLPGTAVRYNGGQENGPEYGVIVHCWLDEQVGVHDCYVAFFGNEQPTGKPAIIPYILRYFSSSLSVIDSDKVA